MARKHWTSADFVETQRHSYTDNGVIGSRSGYCRKCHSDMAWYRDDGFSHYHSHTIAKRLGLDWQRAS